MELTERQRHTKYLNEFQKAESRVQGMIDVLRVLGVSLDDFEQILGKN